jgi:lysophospholipid acyltransferase (LPLAT)-like uncharacterized protein
VERIEARDTNGKDASMKLTSPVWNKLGGLLAVSTVRAWMGTLDFRVAHYDRAVDPALPEYDGPKIYLLWHENILFPIYLRGHCNILMLLSRHRDADVLAEVVRHLGFESIRGSTFDGGSTAMRQLVRHSRTKNLGLTPDGPRGPRRVMAQGPIYLASKLQVPLVCMGYGYDRPWRMNTWDRFAIPRPFSRARCVFGPAAKIPAKLDREGLEYYRLEAELLLTRLTDEAEAWAMSGTSKVGDTIMRRQPMQSEIRRRFDAPHTQSTRRSRARTRNSI